MPYYRVCSFCGAHLDPDEKCDCQRVRGELDRNENGLCGAEQQYINWDKNRKNPLKKRAKGLEDGKD